MRREQVIDVAIALAVFAGSIGLVAVATEADSRGVDAWTVALSALASLPLAARRRAPLAVFVLTALASTALYALAQPAGPPLGPTLALYWLAAADESPLSTPATLALVGVLLVAHAGAGGLAADRFPGTELLFGTLVWGGAWLAGERTRLRRERIAQLEERAERAEREAERERRLAAAEERSRIARELHDSAGHAINVILVHAGLGRLRIGKDPAGEAEAFETIEQVARETVGEIDQLVGALREERVGSNGAQPVEPPPGLAAVGALVERHRVAGMRVTTEIHGEPRELPASVDRSAYRILQEALTNAARHGGGSAAVEVDFEDEVLALTVSNPLGAGAEGRPGGGGHGLTGMRERVALLGGSLEAGAHESQFRVRARLPLAETRP